MKIKKIACLLMALAVIWMTASCRINDGTVTELAEPPGTEQTTPADPGSDGPSKPEPVPSEPDVPEPEVSEPDVTEPDDPTDPSEPDGPVDPVAPSEPDDPVDPSEPVHEHSYSEEVTEATCTEDGYTTYTCDCGDTYESNRVGATGHSWSDWATTKEPTETATGTAERKCSACGATERKVLDKVIPNHTHSYTGKVTTAATCSKAGVKTFTCSCGSSYTESIAKISHSYKETVTKPTCTDKGYTTHKCSVCGDSYKDSYVAATGHSYGNYKSNGDATCTKDGTKTGSCSACGAKNTVTDNGTALGHSYTATKVKEPTMKQDGYTTYTCGRCGDSYKGDYVDKIPQDEFERMVAEATLKYINQFRVEQGDTEAISLPGLTNVAQYRAVQLQDKFEHSFAASREAFAYYQYGEYVDATEYGDDASNSYWSANAKEAIVDGSGGVSDADALGRRFAEVLRNSSGHWSYVGSSEYPFIAFGATWSQNGWRICVLQTVKNYG